MSSMAPDEDLPAGEKFQHISGARRRVTEATMIPRVSRRPTRRTQSFQLVFDGVDSPNSKTGSGQIR